MYTQGEWEKQGLIIATVATPQNDGVIIADCRTSNNLNEMEANAHLIEAAPEMYQALKFAMPYIAKMVADNVNTAIPPKQALERVEKALAKAEGK